MKAKTLIGMAVAGTFAWSAGALAHGGGSGASYEVQTPSSVSESAPWLTGHQYLAGWVSNDMHAMQGNHRFSDDPYATGSSSNMSGSGSVAYDSSMSTTSTGDVASVDYWLLGEGPTRDTIGLSSASDHIGRYDYSLNSFGTGSSSSAAGTGSGSFDSSMSASDSSMSSDIRTAADTGDTMQMTEFYLVPAPIASYDGDRGWTMVVSPTEDSLDQLASVTDLYIVTPIYEDVNTSYFGSGYDNSISFDSSNVSDVSG